MAKKDLFISHEALAYQLGLEPTRLGPNRLRRSLQGKMVGWFSEKEARKVIAHYAPARLIEFDQTRFDDFVNPSVPLQPSVPLKKQEFSKTKGLGKQSWLKSLEFIWGGL